MDNFARVVPYAGPKTALHSHPTLRALSGFSNGNTNISTPRTDNDSLLSQILGNQKKHRDASRKENWLSFGFCAIAVTIYSYVEYNQRQKQDQTIQLLQQRLRQERELSGSHVFVLDSMLKVVVKKLSAQTGESEEAIEKSAAQEIQATTGVGKG